MGGALTVTFDERLSAADEKRVRRWAEDLGASSVKRKEKSSPHTDRLGRVVSVYLRETFVEGTYEAVRDFDIGQIPCTAATVAVGLEVSAKSVRQKLTTMIDNRRRKQLAGKAETEVWFEGRRVYLDNTGDVEADEAAVERFEKWLDRQAQNA